jgi:hypothetical protein
MGLKVQTFLTHGLHPVERTPRGVRFNDAFTERLYEKDEFFRERIILQINEIAGDDWSVKFTEEPTSKPSFLVDIKAKDQYLPPIIRIVSNAFPEFDLSFWKPEPYFHLGSRKAIAHN